MSGIENYLAPRELPDAVKALASGGVTILAGGTDLTPQVDMGRRQYEKTLMNIRNISALSEISQSDGEIRIGSLVTVSNIKNNEILSKSAPILCEAADHFASEQIRNAATIGGNICNASPAGDMINPFLVLGAEVELASCKEGGLEVRREPLDRFFTGPGNTIMNENELLIALVFKIPSQNFVGQFRKSGPRPALEISMVTVGIGGDYKDGTFSNVRVAMGAVAPTPIRAKSVEAALEGKSLNIETIAAAVEAAQEDATPIDDIRASAWYRNHLVAVFTEELLSNVG